MYNINFIACAIDKKGDLYESFLIPFTFFALLSNINSHVEIIVCDPERFISKFSEEIEAIKKYNNNFLIRKLDFKINNHSPNTYRFFEKPIIDSIFTYIADIDIIFLENVLDKYNENWPDNLPYSNVIRVKDTRHLSGVHMVNTQKYFTKDFIECQYKYYTLDKKINDEIVLFNMCKEIHGLPNIKFRFRPILGIHFSPNRGIRKKMKLRTSDKYFNDFIELSKKYNDLFKFKIFSKLLSKLNKGFIIK